MELKDAKKLIKKIGVKSWIESGADVVELGDKLLDSTDTFSRLDYYAKRGNGVKFCEKKNSKFHAAKLSSTTARFCVIIYCEGLSYDR